MKTAYLVVLISIVSALDVLADARFEINDAKNKSISADVDNDETKISEPSIKDFDETEEKVSYEGYQLWKLYLDTQNKSRVVANLRNKNGKTLGLI